MIACKSRFAVGKCVASMDAQESLGGTICCDHAEDCNYDETLILASCEYAEKEEQTGQLRFVMVRE